MIEGKKEIEQEAYKRIPFEILQNVAKFCENHNIRYSLAYGTLLGAVRHKGFIPWDDDIDIIMPRKDYERFKMLYHSERYRFSDMTVNPNHITPMAKVYDTKTFFTNKGEMRSYGLFVDVFVVDNFPTDDKKRFRWQKLIRVLLTANRYKNSSLKKIILSKHNYRKIFKCLLWKLVPIPKPWFQLKISELQQKFNMESTGIVGITMSRDNPYDTYPSNLFEEYIDVEFENHTFKAIRQYDVWLKKCYGDYMQLPPIEKRIGKHGIKAYYI